MTRTLPSEAQSGLAEPSPLVTTLFPGEVIATELRGVADPALLYGDELADCGRFGPQRLADYAAGRLCARRGLAELGFARFPLRRNDDRRPNWPLEVVGSISHTAGFCAAVVAPADAYASLGFDAERAGRITEELWPLAFTRAEAGRFARLPRDRRACAVTIAFAAKEAYFKCQFGLSGAWVDFTDVEIVFELDGSGAGEFRVAPGDRPVALGGSLRGRYAVEGTLVVTGLALPARTPAREY